MCGIAGFVNDMPIDVKCPVLQRMTDMIAHRGPDSEGHYIDEHAALGHRRLSIIDLGGGQQPIYNEDLQIRKAQISSVWLRLHKS